MAGNVEDEMDSVQLCITGWRRGRRNGLNDRMTAGPTTKHSDFGRDTSEMRKAIIKP